MTANSSRKYQTILSFITSPTTRALSLSQAVHSKLYRPRGRWTRAPTTTRLMLRAGHQRPTTPLSSKYATVAPYALPRATAPSEKGVRCTLRVSHTRRQGPSPKTPVHQAIPRHCPCRAPTAPTTPPQSRPLPSRRNGGTGTLILRASPVPSAQPHLPQAEARSHTCAALSLPLGCFPFLLKAEGRGGMRWL